MRRSSTNRRVAGVAGGLGEYLGVDATALRVGFVLVSVLFLAGIGGPLLYVLAWMVLPEEGAQAPAVAGVFSGRPWHDWDRTARSWALVLGSLTLAFIWSFGFWPSWHWRAMPAWLVLSAVVVWAVARQRRTGALSGGPSTPWAPGPSGPAPNGPAPSGAAPSSPGAAPSGPVPAGPAAPEGSSDATDPATRATQAPQAPLDPGGNDVVDLAAQEAADRAAAHIAAAGWAESQLAAAGVATKPGGRPTTAVATGTRGRTSGLRKVVTLLVAMMTGVVLIAVLIAVGVTLGSGSSLRGGAGDSSFAPLTASDVATHYRLGAGNLDLDLSHVRFPPRGQTVDVTVGMGQLKVEVPAGTVVTVDAHAGLGQVEAFGQTASVVQGTFGTGTAHLSLNAHVGMGQIELTRIPVTRIPVTRIKVIGGGRALPDPPGHLTVYAPGPPPFGALEPSPGS